MKKVFPFSCKEPDFWPPSYSCVTLFSLYQNIIPENLGFHKFITTKMNFPILIKKYLRDLSDVPK